jgi:hypothetical protein
MRNYARTLLLTRKRTNNIEGARDRVLKLTAEDRHIDAINDKTWVMIQ